MSIDDMDHTADGSPRLPEGSAAFVWDSPSSIGIGNWFVTTAAGATRDARIDDVVPPRGTSTKACHVSATSDEGRVELWAQLDHPQARAVDLSSFEGIAFWARSSGVPAKLEVAIDDGRGFFGAARSTTPLPSRTVNVSDSWESFMLRFDDLGADPSRVASLDFVVGDGSGPVDLWVDDLALVCSGRCP